MNETPLMECGHAANAVIDGGAPACAICVGLNPGATIVRTIPDLTGRKAKCAYCTITVQSETSLAFFEYNGPGSPRAESQCGNCGYFEVAHVPEKQSKISYICDNFTPKGDSLDTFYCGCRGWD